MKLSLILLGALIAILGIIFTLTIIGAIIGVPMIIIGIIVFVLGIILPLRL